MRRTRTSHHKISHDSIDGLGYDWAQVGADPQQGRHPLTVHLPRTTEEVALIVRNARTLGQRVIVRGSAHSSNNLVTAQRSTLLLTRYLDGVAPVDASASTVTAQAGVSMGTLDDVLAAQGFGLPICPDHPDISLGGFLSVGGISPASHRHGLFVDTVTELEYVDPEGHIRRCGRDADRDQFNRLLAGLGRHGIVTSVTCQVLRTDKRRTVLRNDRTLYRDVDRFIDDATTMLESPGDALMLRGAWIDSGKLGGRLCLGQMAAYYPVAQTAARRWRERLSYAYLHWVGRWAARVPASLHMVMRYLGVLGVMVSPQYASAKNVEMFTDKALDYNVGDPARNFVVLAPMEQFSTVFRKVYDRCLLERRAGAFTYITFHVKGIKSAYLNDRDPDRRYGEIMVVVGCDPQQFTLPLLEEFVADLDALCVEHDSLRYMHTRTSGDPQLSALVDPNARYDRAAERRYSDVGAVRR
ncbi:MAG TPA: FAD-binding oxidoreductase [Jatrophihabitans sp.]|nr:FAD-binding oxidoreductase [Jatrophihabitans sp.]